MWSLHVGDLTTAQRLAGNVADILHLSKHLCLYLHDERARYFDKCTVCWCCLLIVAGMYKGGSPFKTANRNKEAVQDIRRSTPIFLHC